jgi:hypothetical protein
MKLNFTITSLNENQLPGGPAVQVGLRITAEQQIAGAPQPPQIVIYVPPADGYELELNETYSVEIKPDKD